MSIDILDVGGEAALTFRALAARLSTGPGAIYHHVANKGELLVAAADDVIADVLDAGDSLEPERAIWSVVLGVFDAIDARPWVGAQLAAEPWQPAVIRILERVGMTLEALGVPERMQFNAASALVHQVLGVAGQSAASARLSGARADRSILLQAVAEQWTGARDVDDHPFLARMARELAGHDDREQFRTGVELILAGITTLR